MKKTIIKLGLLVLICFIIAGCKDDKVDNYKIVTTEYPIEYLVSRLYGYNSTIKSIYPNDTKISEYSLTDKQIKEYSKNYNLYVYNGLTDEKKIAKELIAKNKKMQIIDVAYGIKYNYGLEELWLSPNNYLTLASTLKDELIQMSTSKYTAENVSKNYEVLKEEIAKLDANLRAVSRSATNENERTVVIAFNSLGFLEDYGFNVINISDESSISPDIRSKFKDKNYTYILMSDSKNIPSYIQDISDNYGTELIMVNTMETLTDNERNNNDNYLTIMNQFVNTLTNKINAKKN